MGSTKGLYRLVQFAVFKRDDFVTSEAPPILVSRGLQPLPWGFSLRKYGGPLPFPKEGKGLGTRLRRM